MLADELLSEYVRERKIEKAPKVDPYQWAIDLLCEKQIAHAVNGQGRFWHRDVFHTFPVGEYASYYSNIRWAGDIKTEADRMESAMLSETRRLKDNKFYVKWDGEWVPFELLEMKLFIMMCRGE